MARDKNDAKQALSYVDEALKNHVKRAGFGGSGRWPVDSGRGIAQSI